MSNTIWVLVELEEGQPARSSLEVLGKAAQLGQAEAIVLGSKASEVASTLGEYGASGLSRIGGQEFGEGFGGGVPAQGLPGPPVHQHLHLLEVGGAVAGQVGEVHGMGAQAPHALGQRGVADGDHPPLPRGDHLPRMAGQSRQSG